MNPLIVLREPGLYIPSADIYIDPMRSVPKAIITHAHSDHAKAGMGSYICQEDSIPLLKARLGKRISVEGWQYGVIHEINGVKISLYPAGHITGSSQVRVEYQGKVWVFSGDYKTEDDGLCVPFEAVRCDVFITESTFGLPVFHWKKQALVFEEIIQWWNENAASGKVSVIHAYSLGKAQRLLYHLSHAGKIFVHPAVEEMNQAVRSSFNDLPSCNLLTAELSAEDLAGSLVITPSLNGADLPSALFNNYSFAVASGWMNLKMGRKRNPADKSFVLSDHADWEGLNTAVELTTAKRVYVTHGYTYEFSEWLNSKGIEAFELNALYDGNLPVGGMNG